MLRIDVSDNTGYSIPPTNPFISDSSVLDEIWALGLRNPWRYSFDSLTNDLWIGDVGQNAIEEIDHVAIANGGMNFGWRCYEGNQPYNSSGCAGSTNYFFPEAQYNQGGSPYRCAITGGYVYRANPSSNLYGYYLFSDFCSGEILAIDTNGSNQILTDTNNFSGNISTFGEDLNGDLYFADLYGGTIYKIIDPSASIYDESLINSIKITPNPAQDFLKFQIKNNTTKIQEIQIIDTLGKIFIHKKQISSSINLMEISTLKKGIYFLKIKTNKGFFVEKLVKK